MMSQPTQEPTKEPTDDELREHARRIADAYEKYVEANDFYDAAVGKGTVVTDSTGQSVEFPSAVSGTRTGSTKTLLEAKDRTWQAVVDSLHAVADSLK